MVREQAHKERLASAAPQGGQAKSIFFRLSPFFKFTSNSKRKEGEGSERHEFYDPFKGFPNVILHMSRPVGRYHWTLWALIEDSGA